MRTSARAEGGRTQFILTASLLVACLVLGGGQGWLGDTVSQLFGLALIGYLVASRDVRRQLFSMRSAACLAALFLVPLALQMLSLPPSISGSIEPRAEIASQLAVVGLASNPHVSLIPLSAERTFWALMPGLAIYWSALSMSASRQRQLVQLLLIMCVLGMILGLMQLAGGPDSPLRFYSNTNRAEAVGFFANRNHMASLLVMGLPLAIAALTLAIRKEDERQVLNPVKAVIAIGMVILLILGLALVRSRAGLVLGMLALLLSSPLLLAFRSHRGTKRLITIGVAATLVLIIQFALFGVLQRLQADPLEDARWKIAHLTVDAARQNAPLGSGAGTFQQLFQTQDVEAPGEAIVNHAHNDFLELWLEAGWLAIISAAILTFAISWAGLAAWRFPRRVGATLAKAVAISLLLVLLHSTIDYPLRTTGNEAVFALLLAVLFSWRWTHTSAVQGSP